MKLGFSHIDAKDYPVVYIEEFMDEDEDFQSNEQAIALYMARRHYLEGMAKLRQECQEVFDHNLLNASPSDHSSQSDWDVLELTLPDRPEWDEFWYS